LHYAQWLGNLLLAVLAQRVKLKGKRKKVKRKLLFS